MSRLLVTFTYSKSIWTIFLNHTYILFFQQTFEVIYLMSYNFNVIKGLLSLDSDRLQHSLNIDKLINLMIK